MNANQKAQIVAARRESEVKSTGIDATGQKCRGDRYSYDNPMPEMERKGTMPISQKDGVS